MSLQGSRMRNIGGICFMVLWCSVAFGMSITALQWGAPLFFALVPFGMGLFEILMCIAISKQGRMAYSLPRRTDRDYVTYSGDSMDHDHLDTQYRRRSFQAPSFCPSCGAAINTDEVDWVAPLKAVCPYCEAVMNAVERTW